VTDAAHDELDRHARKARERLLETLDVLDHRARNLVQAATETTRATAVGLAGALVLSVALVVVQRTSKRVVRRRRDSDRSSLIGDAFRVGAVAIMFVGLSAWAKRAAHANATRLAAAPQLSHHASLALHAERTVQVEPGTVHALDAFETTPHDPGPLDHD
jgi:hypothetical protein